MVFSQPAKPLTTTKILYEAVRLPTKNYTLMLPILLISFITSSLLFVFVTLLITPITKEITSESMTIASLDPASPEFTSIQSDLFHDLRELVAIQSILAVTSFIVSSLLSIATIRALSLGSNKLLTVSDLLCSLARGLKRPMITSLYVKLLSAGYLCLVITLAAFIVFIGRESKIVIATGAVLAILGLILYLYLTVVWSVSVVISVVEDNCYGLEAISKAGEVIRGRKRQGITLAVIEMIVGGVIYGSYSLVKARAFPDSMVSQMAIGLVYVAANVVMAVFALAMIMVFYHDCKEATDGGAFIYVNMNTVTAKDDEHMFP